METKHDKHSGNAFLWGLIIGALFATLLTTKRGRQILRELTDLGLELFEDFVEERTRAGNSEQKDSNTEKIEETADAEEAKEDIESEVTEVETSKQAASGESSGEPKNGNGHKRRLFKGIRRK